MFEYEPPVKIGIDKYTRKVLLGELANRLELKKIAFEAQIKLFFSTEDGENVRPLEKFFDGGLEEGRLDLYLNHLGQNINQILSMFTPKKNVCGTEIKHIIFSAMCTQRILDDYVTKKPVKVRHAWLVKADDHMALVSGYTWDIVCRKYPWCKNYGRVSLVKLDMDRETLTKYNNIVQSNPWAYVPIEDIGENKTQTTTVKFTESLFVPMNWFKHPDTEVKIAEEFLTEEDRNILKLTGEVIWDT